MTRLAFRFFLILTYPFFVVGIATATLLREFKSAFKYAWLDVREVTEELRELWHRVGKDKT